MNEIREVLLGSALGGQCEGGELGKADGVVVALFEEVQLALAHPHVAIEFEEALSRVVEAVQTHRLKFESTSHIERTRYGNI